MYKVCILISIAVGLTSQISCVEVDTGNLHWMPSEEFSDSEDELIPAGYEKSASSGSFEKLYVARMKNDSISWIPSKFLPSKIACIAAFNGKSIEKTGNDCELLIYPRGTVSWTYTSRADQLPDEIVRGGTAHDKEESHDLFICRSRKDGQLLIGRLYPETKSRTCHTVLNGIEYRHKTFEVLSLNLMAKVLGTALED